MPRSIPITQVACCCAAALLVVGCHTHSFSSAGMADKRIAAVSERMAKFVVSGDISGAVTLVMRDGEVAHLDAVGQADLEKKIPMRIDALFAIASMTKPIAATAVLMLEDEGKLSLSDPVAKWIPEFKDVKFADGRKPARPLTIRDLLTHTAGLAGSQRTEKTLEQTAREIAGRPLAYEPGTKWQYSPGLNVCGRIVEIASGKPFDAFLKERIFDPLGMDDTTFSPTPEQRGRIAVLYKKGKGNSLEATEHWLSGDSGQRAPNPSGGLVSSAADMARFYQMILDGGKAGGKRLVSRSAVERMTSLQTGDLKTGFTPGNGWGLGWCIARKPQGVSEALSPGSYGHGGAFGTQGWVDPKRRMIFVLMIQRVGLPNSDASPMRRAFQNTAVDALVE